MSLQPHHDNTTTNSSEPILERANITELIQLPWAWADNHVERRVSGASICWNNVWVASSKHRPGTHQRAGYKHSAFTNTVTSALKCDELHTLHSSIRLVSLAMAL